MDTTEVLLVTIEDAAKALNMSAAKLYLLARSGDLPSVRIGRSIRVPLKALRIWIDQRTEGEPVGGGSEANHP
jgi:excisionase family DNA binding protein